MNCPKLKANLNALRQLRKVPNIVHLFYDVQYENSCKGWSKTRDHFLRNITTSSCWDGEQMCKGSPSLRSSKH